MRAARSRALGAGLAIVALYMAGAAVSGHLSILARRPLLDGYAPPPPYRWVSPPPALAASNQRPLPGKATIPFTGGKSQAGVFRTDDSQAIVVLLAGAIPARSGQSSVTLTLDQVAPHSVGPSPSGLEVAGNVYRIRAAYQPSGAKVSKLAKDAQLVLIYPAPAQAGERHSILGSPTGRHWRRLPTVESPVQHQASTEDAATLGYFAVAVAAGSGTATSPSGGGSGVLPIVVVAAAVVLIAVGWLEYRRSRRHPGPGRQARHTRPR